MVSKSEFLGAKIMERVLAHDLDQGGMYLEVTGAQGTFKTGALLAFTQATLQRYPKDKIFWSECFKTPLQCLRLGIEKIHLMVQEGSNVVFRDRNNHLEKVSIPVTYFTNFEDCFNKAILGKVNVVFFSDRKTWRLFLSYLRDIGEWIHVFIDEISEVAPANPSGDEYWDMVEFGWVMKDVRKCQMKVYTNTQTASDVDYRVRTKIMVKVFLPGARKDPHCRVTQQAIDNLVRDESRGNQAWIEYTGDFGLVVFKDIYRPNPKLQIGAYIDAGPQTVKINES